MMAPVKVARSIIAAGLKRPRAYHRASASTSRPSASVLITSIVWPDIEVTMSPGRCAVPDGPDGVDLGAARSQRPHHPDHRAGPGHVPLHVLHALRRLDRDAAGVEGDSHADEGD